MTTPPSGRIQIVGVSMPRSGHHYLTKLLAGALGADFYHCEFYTPVGCCHAFPCTRGGAARVIFQKNHDFGFAVPTDLPGVTYVVQHRSPVLAALSDREYLARMEGDARADDRDQFVVWLGLKAAYVRRFFEKWLAPAGDGRIVITYEDLLARPADVVGDLLDRLGVTFDRAGLERVVPDVSARVADFPPVLGEAARFAPRTLEASRYFDEPLFAVFESVVIDAVPALAATRLFPAVPTTGHPIALICDAEMSTARGDTAGAATLWRRVAAALPANGHVWHALSAAELVAGNTDRAVEAGTEAVRLRPTDAEILRGLSNAHHARSDSELGVAIDRARALVELRPADPGHLVHLAWLLAARHQYGEAVDRAAAVIGLGPADPHTWRAASEIFARVESWDSAIAAARGALARDESVAEYHGHLGRMLARAGQFDEAIAAIDDALRRAPDAPGLLALRTNVVATRESLQAAVRSVEDRSTPPITAWSDPPTATDVRMAYRLLLAREPENDEVVHGHVARYRNRGELLRAFLWSGEFQQVSLAGTSAPPLDLEERAVALAAPFLRTASDEPPSRAFWIDAVGVRTRCAYRSEWRDRQGAVVTGFEGVPLEWIALFETLADAGDALRVMELGAGYGPWLVRAGVLWRRRHPDRSLRLVGVEGEPAHFGWLQQHAADNDLPPECLKLIAGAVGDRDGLAVFEAAERPAANYDTRLATVGAPSGVPRVAGVQRMSVPMRSLATLADGLDRIDLVHMDIQGSEHDVIAASRDVVAEKVSRLFVGTHSRAVEASLLQELPALGFRLVAETPSRYEMRGREPLLVRDGGQYWINVRISG